MFLYGYNSTCFQAAASPMNWGELRSFIKFCLGSSQKGKTISKAALRLHLVGLNFAKLLSMNKIWWSICYDQYYLNMALTIQTSKIVQLIEWWKVCVQGPIKDKNHCNSNQIRSIARNLIEGKSLDKRLNWSSSSCSWEFDCLNSKRVEMTK